MNSTRKIRVERRQPSERARALREKLFPSDGYNVVDVGHVLGVDSSTVRRYIRDGELIAAKVGKEYIVTEQDLCDYVERQIARKREQQRIGRVKREVEAHYQQVRGTVAAHRWRYTTCYDCASPVMLHYDGFDEGDGVYIWSGQCGVCGQSCFLKTRSDESIAAEDEAASETEHEAESSGASEDM